MTAGTDINVLKREITALRNGNWKKARIKAMTSAIGVAIKMAEKETPKDNDMISHMSALPLSNNWKAFTLAWLRSFTGYNVFNGGWVK